MFSTKPLIAGGLLVIFGSIGTNSAPSDLLSVNRADKNTEIVELVSPQERIELISPQQEVTFEHPTNKQLEQPGSTHLSIGLNEIQIQISCCESD